jgi:hypothetical protein
LLVAAALKGIVRLTMKMLRSLGLGAVGHICLA